MLKSKLMIVLIIVAAIIVLLLAIGRKSVHAEITINASSESVWSVLTDVATIKDWNKVLIPTDGELAEGGKVTYEFYQEEGGKAAVMSANVKEIVSESLINQTGGVPMILTFNHKYLLEQSDAGTKVIIHEEYRGMMVPFWNPDPVEKAYQRLLEMLKERVESN